MYEALIPVKWEGDYVAILDQTLLPTEEKYLRIRDIGPMWDAIKMLCVRGAPAIGIAAAYGVAIEMQKYVKESVEEYHKKLKDSIDYLATSRPTAVNLFWALERMKEAEKHVNAKAMKFVTQNWNKLQKMWKHMKQMHVLRSVKMPSHCWKMVWES